MNLESIRSIEGVVAAHVINVSERSVQIRVAEDASIGELILEAEPLLRMFGARQVDYVDFRGRSMGTSMIEPFSNVPDQAPNCPTCNTLTLRSRETDVEVYRRASDKLGFRGHAENWKRCGCDACADVRREAADNPSEIVYRCPNCGDYGKEIDRLGSLRDIPRVKLPASRSLSIARVQKALDDGTLVAYENDFTAVELNQRLDEIVKEMENLRGDRNFWRNEANKHRRALNKIADRVRVVHEDDKIVREVFDKLDCLAHAFRVRDEYVRILEVEEGRDIVEALQARLKLEDDTFRALEKSRDQWVIRAREAEEKLQHLQEECGFDMAGEGETLAQRISKMGDVPDPVPLVQYSEED